MDAALLRRAAEQDAATEWELEPPVLERLGIITTHVLAVVGAFNQPDARTSADVLVSGILGARRLDILGAAYLPGIDAHGSSIPESCHS